MAVDQKERPPARSNQAAYKVTLARADRSMVFGPSLLSPFHRPRTGRSGDEPGSPRFGEAFIRIAEIGGLRKGCFSQSSSSASLPPISSPKRRERHGHCRRPPNLSVAIQTVTNSK